MYLVQVLGLLVEKTKDGFHTHISRVLPVVQRILQSCISKSDVSCEGHLSLWNEAYYSLVLLEKILFPEKREKDGAPELCFKKDLEVL